jgi:hypothetical protein
MLLAAAGVCGVFSYSAAQRTEEIGVRLTLGADRRGVVRLVAAQAMGLATLGIAVGTGGARLLTRVLPRLNPDGSLTLYAGAQSPGKDEESNWLPAPHGHFSLYLRAYWADQPVLDGTWEPPVITSVEGTATRIQGH